MLELIIGFALGFVLGLWIMTPDEDEEDEYDDDNRDDWNYQ